MLTVLREKRVEVAKFVAGMLVFAILSRWHFLPEDYTASEIVKLLVDFIASVVVVLVVSDIALGQPTITLEWRTEKSNRPHWPTSTLTIHYSRRQSHAVERWPVREAYPGG